MKQLKFLVYGEGPDDYGWKDSTGGWRPGSIIYLLKKCAEEMNVDLEIEYVEKRFIDGKDKVKLAARHLRKVEGKGIPALRFSMYAVRKGYTEGIFYCDTDKVISGNQKEETHCRKYFEKIYSDVLPSKLELIWGEKNNPASDYPKNYLKRVLEQYYQKPDRETYIDIADEISIETLKEKCPISFRRFYEDFAELCKDD